MAVSKNLRILSNLETRVGKDREKIKEKRQLNILNSLLRKYFQGEIVFWEQKLITKQIQTKDPNVLVMRGIEKSDQKLRSQLFLLDFEGEMMNAQRSTMDMKEKCGICFPTDPETPCINQALLDRLKVAKRHGLSREQNTEDGKTEFIDFHRLVKMMFNRKYRNFKSTSSCKHMELKRQFSAKLKCSFKDLDKISDCLAWKISKYNFHLDTLCNQVKNFPRHFPTKAKNTSSQSDQTHKKISNEENFMDKSGTIKKNFVENKHEDSFQKGKKISDGRENPESEIELIDKKKHSPSNNAEKIQKPRNEAFKNHPEMMHTVGPTMTSFGQFPDFMRPSQFYNPINMNWAIFYPSQSNPVTIDLRNGMPDSQQQQESHNNENQE